jgi:hypothetical protein
METGAPDLKPDVEGARLWYGIALSRPAADAEGQALQRRARERLAALPEAAEQMVPFTGGRYLFRGLAAGRCMIALQGRITPDTSNVFPAWSGTRARKAASHPGSCWSPAAAPSKTASFSATRCATRRATPRWSHAPVHPRAGWSSLGGRERILIGPEARIGFHQASEVRAGDPRSRRCIVDPVAPVNVSMLAYLNQVIGPGFGRTLGLILGTPCESMSWVQARALVWRIATAVR